jgi:hypothetical protein
VETGQKRCAQTPVLSEVLSRQLREKLLAEVGALKGSEAFALWAQRRLATKNTITADDARILLM